MPTLASTIPTGDSTQASTTRVPSISVAVYRQVSPPGGPTPDDKPHVPSVTTHTPAPTTHPPLDGHEDSPPPAEPPPEVPAGSLWAHLLQNTNRPRSPSTPFEFPLDPGPPPSPSTYKTGPSVLRVAELPDFPSIMDSVTCVVGSSRVFGLMHDSSSYIQVWRTSTSLMDAGANICLTGDLNLLVDVV